MIPSAVPGDHHTTTADLDAVRERRAAYLRSHDHMGAFACCSAHASADDVPALLAEVDRLQAENQELDRELDGRDKAARKRWIKRQEKELSIRSMEFREGRWEMDLAGAREMAAAYTAMARTMLGDAPNYTETKLYFDVKIAESPETYTLVVQRHAPGALTPHEARQKAEAEVERLRAELATARAGTDDHVTRALDYLAARDTTHMSTDAVSLAFNIVAILDGPGDPTATPAVCTCGAAHVHQHGCQAGQ